MSEPQRIGACAVLINPKNQVLLGKRKNSYKAGMYGLPGGRIELNEAMMTAITREVAEETRLTGLVFSFVGVVRENQGEYDFVHCIFAANITDQQPVLCEPDKCEGWEWLDLDKDFMEVLPGHRAGIKLYKNGGHLVDLVTN